MLTLTLIAIFACSASAAPVTRDLTREERQWGLYKSLHGMLPQGKHSLSLPGIGDVGFGVNEDGTISLGGHVGIAGLNLGGEVGIGGNEETGLGFKSSGSASLKNELLGLDSGVSGGYEGAIKGLSVSQKAHGEAGLMVGGVGVHGGLEGASSGGLSMNGISAGVSAGGNAGADIAGLASVGAGAGAGVEGTVGLGGVSGSVSGGATAGASGELVVR